jgi:hypothetical protein
VAKKKGFVSAVLVAAGMLMVSACGGGGGESTTPPSNTPTVSLVPPSTPIQIEAVNRFGGKTVASVTFGPAIPDGAQVFVNVAEPTALLADVKFFGGSGQGFAFEMFAKPELPVGTAKGELKVFACKDDKCAAQYPGSPLSIPFTINVTPNIEIQPRIDIKRTGAEIPSLVEVPLSIPPKAGIDFNVTQQPDYSPGFNASFKDGKLIIQPRAVKAGIYEARYRIYNFEAGGAYSTETQIRYEVLPPAGGERDWTYPQSTVRHTLRQGEKKTVRVTVTAPTWQPGQVVLSKESVPAWLQVQPLGGNEYELKLDASGQPAQSFAFADLAFSAGDATTYGASGASFRVVMDVEPAFQVSGPDFFEVLKTMTQADLNFAYDITTTDGAAATWSASVNVPWLKLRTSTGSAGIDKLVVDIAPEALTSGFAGSRVIGNDAPAITFSIDRPGVLEQIRGPYINNRLNIIDHVWPVNLQPNKPGRIFLYGKFEAYERDVFASGALTVAGARLVNHQVIQDMRYVGDVRYLVILDIADMVAGRPVEIVLNQGIASKTLSFPVATSAALTEATFQLPVLERKPLVYSVKHQALYIAEKDQIRVLRFRNGNWSATVTSTPSLIDLDLSTDESKLIAAFPTQLKEIDPLSMQTLRTSTLQGWSYGSTASLLDNAQSDHAITVGLSSKPWAVAIERSPDDLGAGTERTSAFSPSGSTIMVSGSEAPGSSFSVAPPPPLPATWRRGFIRSEDRGVMLTFASGSSGANHRLFNYKIAEESGFPGFAFPAESTPVGISGDGNRMIDQEGIVFDKSGPSRAPLAVGAQIPAGWKGRGFNFSLDGSLVYAYATKLEQNGSGYIETSPALFTFRVAVSLAGQLTATLIDTKNLSAPVSCRSANLNPSDCSSPVRMTVDSFGGHAFIQGRDGIQVAKLSNTSIAALKTKTQPSDWRTRVIKFVR